MVRSVCNPPFAKSREGWGTHCVVCHRKTGPPAKERDSESGLDNFGERYHASAMGRFMSPDPIGIMRQKLSDPQQWNMYAYTRNNPLRFMDAKGMYNTDFAGMPNTDCETELGRCSRKIEAQTTLSAGPDEIARHAAKGGAEGSPPPDVQKAIDEGTPPSANMISCPNCKYYPKDVQEAVKTHEREHMKQLAVMGGAEGAACSAIKSCHRAMELEAYWAESKFVNKRLSELNAEQATGPLSPQDQISQRVLKEMKAQEDNFFKYPTLLDDK